MSRASALLSGLAALLLLVVVGNPPANEAILDQLSDGNLGPGLTLRSAGFLSWDVFDQFGDLGPAAIVRSVLFVVLAALLGGIVGRSPKLAALIGGWGAGMAAAIVASVGYVLVIDSRFAGLATPDPSFTDRITAGIQAGAVAGVLPSLVIAVAVAIGARPKVVTAAAAPAPGGWAPAPGPQQPAPVAAAPGPPPGAPAQAAPPPTAAPAAPVGGPAVGAPPPRPGTTQPTPSPTDGPPPAAGGASDATQRIPPAR